MTAPQAASGWRRLRRLARWLVGGAAACGGVIWIAAFLAAPAPLVSAPGVGGPGYRASGVVHVHTDLSDGYGSPSAVIAAAARAKADFIVIADHNRVDPDVLDRLGGLPGDPIVIAGSEISTEAGHVLAIGIRPPAFRFSGTLSEVLDDIRHLGGCAFVAHPTSLRAETRFTGAANPGSWGVEVVNGDSAWREASAWSLALAAWTYPVNSAYALRQTLGAFETERALWDQLLASRYVPVVGGADAHGRIPLSRNASLPLPSYESLFGTVRTVLQLKEPLPQPRGAARSAVAHGLCAGESVVAIPSLADPKGFDFAARSPVGESFGPGSTVRFEPGVVLYAGGSLPVGTTLRLMESGRVVATGESTLEYPVGSEGVFRVEAYLPGVATPWVLSNPISVLSPAAEARRTEASRPILEDFVQGTAVIDRFEGQTAFAAEHDPGSSVTTPILDAKGGRGSGSAVRLAFRLNPSPRPPVWAALVDRTSRDLSRNKGVSFWLRADGEYRIWFQIRDLNPASADEGTEAWFASVRTSTAWTLYNIPFAALRSINKTSDGRFDPSRVAHIVFVIDHGAMPFGSSGSIWIDDLMAY